MVSRQIFSEAQGSGVSIPFPAPVQGLNTRDSFIQLQPTEARELTNWLPDTGACSIRPGTQPFSTIPSNAPVKTLAPYSEGIVNGLVGASGGALYNAISEPPTLLKDGYTNDLWSTDFMNGFLFGVNGVDTPWRFDGTSITDTGFTGPPLTSLRTVKAVQNRLWFTVNGSGDVYYGGQAFVTGPLTLFELSQIASGGECVAVYPWQQYTVFFMSTGQVLVYQGDPAGGLGSGADFTIVSKYFAPALIEPDACMKMGNELMALTRSGPISIDVIAAGTAFNLESLGNWSKIAPSWQADFKTFGHNRGWFGRFLEGIAYFNVATGSETTKQYVFNTRNQAWTTYQDMSLASMDELNGTIFIGSAANDGMVYTHAGGNDNGRPISSIGRPGFSYLNDSSKRKVFNSIKPNIFTTGQLSGQFQIDVDFISAAITGPVAVISSGGITVGWGSPWGSAWGNEVQNIPQWLTVNATGNAASAVVKALSNAEDVQWFSSDVMTVFVSAK